MIPCACCQSSKLGRIQDHFIGDNNLYENRDLYTVIVSGGDEFVTSVVSELIKDNTIAVNTTTAGGYGGQYVPCHPSWHSFNILIYKLYPFFDDSATENAGLRGRYFLL